MAKQPLAAKRNSRVKRAGRWLRDRVWASLDPPPNLDSNVQQSGLEINADEEVVRAMYERLSAELEAEDERKRSVETKLIAAGSVASIAVTIMGSVATFLTSELLWVGIAMAYAALQFLRATLAVISGLSRKSYSGPTTSAILSAGTEGLVGYLREASIDHVKRLVQHRETTNENVSQLALAHTSIKNALVALVVALVVALLILSGLIDLVWNATTAVWLCIWRQLA